MLKDQKAPYSNPALVEYFKPFITVIEDQEINKIFAQLSKNIQLPLGVSFAIRQSLFVSRLWSQLRK